MVFLDSDTNSQMFGSKCHVERAMQAQKLSFSLPRHLYDFVEQYQDEKSLSSRSEVIQVALNLLQAKYLEQCYAEANREWAGEMGKVVDGVVDEAW